MKLNAGESADPTVIALQPCGDDDDDDDTFMLGSKVKSAPHYHKSHGNSEWIHEIDHGNLCKALALLQMCSEENVQFG